MASKEHPPHSYDLIIKLDKMYPPVRPEDDISDRELWGRIYQRRLVDSLITQFKVTIPKTESE